MFMVKKEKELIIPTPSAIASSHGHRTYAANTKVLQKFYMLNHLRPLLQLMIARRMEEPPIIILAQRAIEWFFAISLG